MEKSNWILIKDALPEPDQFVLISRKAGYKEYYTELVRFEKGEKESYFSRGAYSYIGFDEVSAWQPTPEPYIPENKKKFKKINCCSGELYIRKIDGWHSNTLKEELHTDCKDIRKYFGNCNLVTVQYVDAAWGIEDKAGRVVCISCHKKDKPHETKNWRIDGDKSLVVDIFGKNKVK